MRLTVGFFETVEAEMAFMDTLVLYLLAMFAIAFVALMLGLTAPYGESGSVAAPVARLPRTYPPDPTPPTHTPLQTTLTPAPWLEPGMSLTTPTAADWRWRRHRHRRPGRAPAGRI